MQVLANVNPKKSKVDGTILFNNQAINPKTHHRNISCIIIPFIFILSFYSSKEDIHDIMKYITQNDNHMPTLTVRETLWFSSECILPSSLNEATKQHRLDVSFYL